MNSLAGVQLRYEPVKKHKYKISKENKMGNKTEVPTAETRKVYEKTRGEHFKDIIIAVLLTSIVAFIVGAQYQSRHTADITRAVAAVEQPAKK